MPELKLSVLIPAYNERYLVRELLRRVLAVEVEGVSAIEVVVVDDGSTDGTREILRELAASEPRLRYIEHPKIAARAPRCAPGSPPPPAT